MWADECLAKLLTDHDHEFVTVLDVGSGHGEQATAFRQAGKIVTETDLSRDGDYLLQRFPVPFDLVWASHVLEHQPNAHAFLLTLAQDCKPGGLIAITVPPLKHAIVGGHVSLWNAGLLLYHLALVGVDCRNARVKTYGYNISVIVRNNRLPLPELRWDAGDIGRLSSLLPDFAIEGFNGNIAEYNW